MVRLTVLYPRAAGKRFDMDYYVAEHFPLARRLLGDALVRDEIWQPTSGVDGGPAAFVAIGHLYFDGEASLAAQLAEHGRALAADIPRYTDIEPVMIIERAPS